MSESCVCIESVIRLCPRCKCEVAVQIGGGLDDVLLCKNCDLVFAKDMSQITYWKESTGWTEVPKGCLYVSITEEPA